MLRMMFEKFRRKHRAKQRLHVYRKVKYCEMSVPKASKSFRSHSKSKSSPGLGSAASRLTLPVDAETVLSETRVGGFLTRERP